MLQTFKDLSDENITPNGLYVIMCMKFNVIPQNMSFPREVDFLEKHGYLVNDELSDKAHNIIDKYFDIVDNKKSKKNNKLIDLERVAEYREIFPKGVLPSNQPARAPVKELEKKFIWFFNNYDYDWETILKATNKYVNEYSLNAYMYMKTSGYFILKNEKGVNASALASYCDMILDGADSSENDYDFHKTL
jgi:hypothetical protein